MLDDLSRFRVLIVPGLHNSGKDHWQTRWQEMYPAFERVEQDQWDVPVLEKWSGNLSRDLRKSSRETLIAAHSFGCLATVYETARHAGSVAGALLVAPADPEKFLLTDKLNLGELPFPSLVIGSRNDPWMKAEAAKSWAHRWGSEFIDAGELGHINAESGLGNWDFGLNLLRSLARISLSSRWQRA